MRLRRDRSTPRGESGNGWLKRVKALPSTVWLLGGMSLLNDTASALIYPLMPLYLVSMLGAGPGALGLVEGVAAGAGNLSKLLFGVLADRGMSTRRSLMLGYGMAGFARPALALAGNWPAVLALRFVDRVGGAVRASPRDAMLAQSVARAQRGLAFGLHRSLNSLGAVIGPLIAAWLLARGLAIRDILVWSLVPALITLALSLALREPGHEQKRARAPFSWTLSGFPVAFKRYLLAVGLFALANSSNMFLLLRAKELGMSSAQIPLLWATVSLAATVLAPPLAALSDRVERKRLIITGWCAYAAVYLVLGLDGIPRDWLWPLFALYGVFLAATEGTEKAFIADLTPPPLLGTAYGWFSALAGLLVLPASLLFGWLWHASSSSVAFSVGAACALGAALVLGLWVDGRVAVPAVP